MTQNFSSITTVWAEAAVAVVAVVAAARNYKEIIDEEFDFRFAVAHK